EARNALLFDQLLLDKPFGRKLPKALQQQWLVFRVGLVAAIEHFTAALGVFVLEADAWDQHGADPVVADLFRWHGAEEVEHRTVAYDHYRHLGGTHSMRTLAMTLVLPTLVGLAGAGMVHMQHYDDELNGASSKQPALLRLISGWRRSARLGTFPAMHWFPMHALRFIRPGYNPLHEASTEQALAYINSSPGVLAAA
ncbi:MAG: metal-dependent hydrolase, partial [Salinisphaeraceae bacterium]|nr:metal-dependent hydrolase [Salinisphaeraceae bacterium]